MGKDEKDQGTFNLFQYKLNKNTYLVQLPQSSWPGLCICHIEPAPSQLSFAARTIVETTVTRSQYILIYRLNYKQRRNAQMEYMAR